MKICAHANQYQNDHLLKKEWYMERQKVAASVTTSRNEWQQVTTSDTKSENEWQWEETILIELNPKVQCNPKKCQILYANLTVYR